MGEPLVGVKIPRPAIIQGGMGVRGRRRTHRLPMPGGAGQDYLRKGGDRSNTDGRKCICNGLTSTVGLGQRRHGVGEPPIVTAGNDLMELGRLLGPGRHVYHAADVVEYLLRKPLAARDPGAIQTI